MSTKPITLPPPDTHCFDDDTQRDCWSYSAELVRQIVAAERARLSAPLQTLRDVIVAQNRLGADWHSSIFAKMMDGLSSARAELGFDAPPIAHKG